MARSILLGLLILLGAGLLLARSTTVQTVRAFPMRGPDDEARRQRAIDFAATCDWRGELARAGVALPEPVIAQVISPLFYRTPDENLALLEYRIQVVFRGPEAIQPRFADVARATALIDARLRAEVALIDAASGAEPEVRRRRLWQAYGSGFDARVLAFLAERRTAEPDPELRAFVEELHRHLAARVAAAQLRALQPPHSQSP